MLWYDCSVCWTKNRVKKQTTGWLCAPSPAALVVAQNNPVFVPLGNLRMKVD